MGRIGLIWRSIKGFYARGIKLGIGVIREPDVVVGQAKRWAVKGLHNDQLRPGT